tara:strand:+ start:1270 stop:1824 length:555 start_codon:yes stop_codon:yes gene_type:complete
MDRLFIKVDSSNTPINGIHPSWESNLRSCFPEHDWTSDAPPTGYKLFERVAKPSIGIYQKFKEEIGADIAGAFDHNGLEYKYFPDTDKVTDVWHYRDMTDVEKQAKQDAVKDSWKVDGYASWIFDETICDFRPPVDYPSDNKIHAWKESTQEWVQFPYNEDEKYYEWDKTNELWKEVVEEKPPE